MKFYLEDICKKDLIIEKYYPKRTLITADVDIYCSYQEEGNCENVDGSYDKFLEKVKPNVIIYTAKIDHVPRMRHFPSKNMSKDTGYKAVLKTLLHIQKFTDRLIIIQPSPVMPPKNGYQHPLTVAHLLFTHKNLDTFDIPIEYYRKLIYPGWMRFQEAAKQCFKCTLIETEKIFCNEKFCPVIDAKTKLARYCDYGHITPRDSLKLIPDLVHAIDQYTI
uniref:SGNH domain-containing protein n=1 Tax=Panagrolaimus sp. ES5 TaxID=591445 RepID=A0AC34GPN7_9BILA